MSFADGRSLEWTVAFSVRFRGSYMRSLKIVYALTRLLTHPPDNPRSDSEAFGITHTRARPGRRCSQALLHFMVLLELGFHPIMRRALLKGTVRFTGPAMRPDPTEPGWKNKVRADPSVITRIIIPFEGFAGR